jgi:3-deoxy-D-manno-octulosonic-acid transferase
MTFSYRALIALLTPLIFIYLWARGTRAPEYRQRWRERLAFQVVPIQARDGIVIHCVSVGETVAARGLIEAILQHYPQLPITLTAMTPTAAELARKLFGQRVHHAYLPIDSKAAMRRFIDKFAPRCLIILETELWPNLLAQTKQRGIKVIVVNARLSAKSFESYQRFSWLLGPIWSALDLVICQHADTERRFQELGVRRDRTVVRGNLKFDCQVPATTISSAQQWRAEQQRPMIVAASTHQGEDGIILQSFAQVLRAVPDALLIIVPRHPERFREVTALAQQQFATMTRSSGLAVLPSHQVLIGDSMGELLFWYAAADVAVMGGSLITRGGHNPLEPIATKTPVISGRHVFNFQQLYDRLHEVKAVRFVDDAQQLAEQCLQLLQQPEQGQAMATLATEEFATEHGATARVLADIKALFPAPTNRSARTLKMIQTLHPKPGTEIWYDDSLANAITDDYFEPSFWRQQDKIIGSATGRASAWFIQHQPQNMLLRHYYRGGLVGKVNRDRFSREALIKSRAMAEFSLLLQLRELDLPVPQPIAARYQRAPIWGYRADILVAVIANSQDLFKLLLQRSLTAAEWCLVGATIRQLHQAGVYHSDLNCHNLMLDQAGKVWIVDFDKCGFRAEGEWQQANLQRLLRSLVKEQGKAEQGQQPFHWQQTTDWPELMRGYQDR